MAREPADLPWCRGFPGIPNNTRGSPKECHQRKRDQPQYGYSWHGKKRKKSGPYWNRLVEVHEKWGEMMPFLWTNRPGTSRASNHGPLCVIQHVFGRWLSRTRVWYTPSYCKLNWKSMSSEKVPNPAMDHVLPKILWLSDSHGFGFYRNDMKTTQKF